MLPERFSFIKIPKLWDQETSTRIVAELLLYGDQSDTELAKRLETNKVRVGRVRRWLRETYPQLHKDTQATKLWSSTRSTDSGRSWTRHGSSTTHPLANPIPSPGLACDDWEGRLTLVTEAEFEMAYGLEELLTTPVSSDPLPPSLEPAKIVHLVLTELPRTKAPNEVWRMLCDRALPLMGIHGFLGLVLHQEQLLHLVLSLEDAVQKARSEPPSRPPSAAALRRIRRNEPMPDLDDLPPSAAVREPKYWARRMVMARVTLHWILAVPRKHRYRRADREPPWAAGVSQWKPVALLQRRPAGGSITPIAPMPASDLLGAGIASGDQFLAACRELIRAVPPKENKLIFDPFPQGLETCLASLLEGCHFLGVLPNDTARLEFMAKVNQAMR